jgi:membrane-associated phospholipid phosphatase
MKRSEALAVAIALGAAGVRTAQWAGASSRTSGTSMQAAAGVRDGGAILRTAGDSTWTPLSATPADPSYPGAHSAVSAAAATVLASFFGDRDRLTVTSEVAPGAARTFRSYRAAATEAGLSRIYAGVHTRLDHRAGAVLGRRVAAFVLRQSVSSRFGLSPRG